MLKHLQHHTDESSPESPWFPASAGKVAFYSQRSEPSVLLDPAFIGIFTLLPLRIAQHSLQEGMWDDGNRRLRLHSVALPLGSWVLLSVLTRSPLPRWWSALMPAAAHSGRWRSYVFLGVLDAISSLLISLASARVGPAHVHMVTGCAEVFFVQLLQRRSCGEDTKLLQTLGLATALSAISWLAAMEHEEEATELHWHAATSATGLSGVGVFAVAEAPLLCVLCALCLAARLALGAECLRTQPRDEAVGLRGCSGDGLLWISGSGDFLKAAIVSGISCTLFALVAALIIEGAPPWPAGQTAAMCATLLVVAPAALLVEMIALQHLPPLAVAVLEVLCYPLGVIFTAILSEGPITLCQLSALMVVLLGMATTSAQSLFVIGGPLTMTKRGKRA